MLSFFKNIFKKGEHDTAQVQKNQPKTTDATTVAATEPTPSETSTAPEASVQSLDNTYPAETATTTQNDTPSATTETTPSNLVESVVESVAPSEAQTSPITDPIHDISNETTSSANHLTTTDITTKEQPETLSPPPSEPQTKTSWATPTAEIVRKTLRINHDDDETKASNITHWAQSMGHAIHDKVDELEMRTEIAAEESSEAIKSWVNDAESWAQGMAGAVKNKVDELEMRAQIVTNEAAEAIEESIENIEHTVIGEITPQPELLPENVQPKLTVPTPADAATEIDENHPTNVQRNHQTALQATPNLPIAAEAATVLSGDDEEVIGWTARLARGLSKSRNQMAKSLASVFGGGKIDEDLYEELETVLITSDMGIEATEHLMQEVRNRVSLKGLKDGNELRQALKEALYDLIKPLEKPLEIPNNGQPFVIMMAGINGAGKTTSIGKLAKYFQAQGKSVMLAAGDTFRAAAREQLQEWGERNNVTVISQEKGDSAAVCFDAVEAAKARKIDIVLADTAGRLPTQLHLMEEIKKVKRVLQKSMSDAPHEIIVVLDANIGQNAINQVIAFDDALGVTGLIVTKLDGTAKGGILAALASNRAIPVRYIGVGESIDDLRPFNARAFVDALLSEHKEN